MWSVWSLKGQFRFVRSLSDSLCTKNVKKKPDLDTLAKFKIGCRLLTFWRADEVKRLKDWKVETTLSLALRLKC